MHSRIEELAEIRLVGNRVQMSFAENRTPELWQMFMPRLKEVQNAVGTELYSVEVYTDTAFFSNFDPRRPFDKWAALRVLDFSEVPPGMETLIIPHGLYAAFLYKGKGSEAASAYEYIFNTWLPKSGYALDNRPHFALMGEKYRNEDPESEEDLYIPIKIV
jgi:AraC family transcriptional regulator